MQFPRNILKLLSATTMAVLLVGTSASVIAAARAPELTGTVTAMLKLMGKK
jgi:hypothetical protein